LNNILSILSLSTAEGRLKQKQCKSHSGGLGIMKYSLKIFISFSLMAGLQNLSYSQPLNYKDIFGDDWKKAVIFEKENRYWMEPALAENNISYPLAVAVIFPELVRYSALLDKIEITLLKTLYINLGDDYANFSIGQFQMKPSFAELIREQAPAVLSRKSGIIFRDLSDFDNIKVFRRSIVTDLEDPKIQFNYLVAFLREAS